MPRDEGKIDIVTIVRPNLIGTKLFFYYNWLIFLLKIVICITSQQRKRKREEKKNMRCRWRETGKKIVSLRFCWTIYLSRIDLLLVWGILLSHWIMSKQKKKQDNFLIYIFRISLLLDFMICLSKVEFNLKYYGSSTILLTNWLVV